MKSLSTGFLTRPMAELKVHFTMLVEWRFQWKVLPVFLAYMCLHDMTVMLWKSDYNLFFFSFFFKKQINSTSMVCWRSRRCMCAVEGKLRQTLWNILELLKTSMQTLYFTVVCVRVTEIVQYFMMNSCLIFLCNCLNLIKWTIWELLEF